MRSPFPGMDPYLEHPALWPDVHNRLIAAIADDLAPRLAPRYYVALERRAYLLAPTDLGFVGRPDLSAVTAEPVSRGRIREAPPSMNLGGTAALLEVEVPLVDEVAESYLEVRDVATGRLVTVLELLSPANKLAGPGRDAYETKRESVFRTWTSLVEVDLLRSGAPMPVFGPSLQADYRILVSRGRRRPRGQLYLFNLPDPIPAFPLPLQPGDDEPELDLGRVLHALYERARFDLRLDYRLPPVPALVGDSAEWAAARVRAALN